MLSSAILGANSAWDSIWDVLLYMILFFLLMAWIVLLVQIFGDLMYRDESGWAKAAWVFFIFFFPLIGALVYLIFNGSGMQRREVEQAKASDAMTTAYIRQAAGTGGPADQLKALKAMRDANEISESDYEKAKAKVLD